MDALTYLWPIVVTEDRYGGVYSRGAWVAVSGSIIEVGATTRMVDRLHDMDDVEAMRFWDDPPNCVAVGSTPNAAVNALVARFHAERGTPEYRSPFSST